MSDVKLYNEAGSEMSCHPSDVERLKKQHGWSEEKPVEKKPVEKKTAAKPAEKEVS